MKGIIRTGLAAVMFISAIGAHAAIRSHSGAIIVDRPADLPEAAQDPTISMDLHENGNGETLLYLEQNNGKRLAVLDVTDPASIHTIAQVALKAPASFDFVRNLGDDAALIRYRDGSGYATVDFRRTKRPILTPIPQMTDASLNETLGQTALLQESTAVAPTAAAEPTNYRIIDLSGPAGVVVLGSVDQVSQSLTRPETGTVFLLSAQGLVVVRRTRVEQEYRNQEIQMEHN